MKDVLGLIALILLVIFLLWVTWNVQPINLHKRITALEEKVERLGR